MIRNGGSHKKDHDANESYFDPIDPERLIKTCGGGGTERSKKRKKETDRIIPVMEIPQKEHRCGYDPQHKEKTL